jgi:hypothetical protein
MMSSLIQGSKLGSHCSIDKQVHQQGYQLLGQLTSALAEMMLGVHE